MAEETLQSSTKSAWQRPENWFTWGGLAVAGYVVLRGLDTILPLVNRVFENLLYTGILAGGLSIFGFLAFNKDLHKLAWYGYKIAMKKLTGLIIEIDPIAILETFKETLQDKYQEIVSSLGRLRAQRKSLEELIRTKTAAYEHSMKMAKQAQARSNQNGMRIELKLQSRKAGRLEKSAMTYQGLLNKLNGHIALTEKIQEASKFMIEDISDTIDEEKEKRETIRESYKAMAAAKRILMEGRDKEMYDLALESVKDDYFNKLGEIEQFMEDSQSFVNTMDLQNGVYEEDALVKLEEWNKRSASLLEGGTGKTKFRIDSPVNTSNDDDDGAGLQDNDVEQRQSYADLFKIST